MCTRWWGFPSTCLVVVDTMSRFFYSESANSAKWHLPTIFACRIMSKEPIWGPLRPKSIPPLRFVSIARQRKRDTSKLAHFKAHKVFLLSRQTIIMILCKNRHRKFLPTKRMSSLLPLFLCGSLTLFFNHHSDVKSLILLRQWHLSLERIVTQICNFYIIIIKDIWLALKFWNQYCRLTLNAKNKNW